MSATAGTGEQTTLVTVKVNGAEASREVPTRMLLSDFIRHELDLTGTHVGCEHGVCGCCTVLVDGVSARSCLAFASQADGSEITTVEGLLDADGALSPLQQAFKEKHALQCGFCTPGFLIAITEFLEREHPQLSVGRRSALRAQLVSDRWLAELAEACTLEPVLRIGAVAGGDRAGRATVRAECAEALVGGLYEAWGGGSAGLEAVHGWLTPHWRRTVAELLADPHRHNWKTALQEWSPGPGLGLPAYRCQERSRSHGDPRRFHCYVAAGDLSGEGWGGSRREAEQQAARSALAQLRPPAKC